jgi:hypothetical protein
VTFDETAPCPRGVFEYAGDMEMEESIFVLVLPQLKQRLLGLPPPHSNSGGITG